MDDGGRGRDDLRDLGERGDIIKRMHRALTERGLERGASNYVLAGESLGDPIVGRLVDRGLDDELKGTAYAVVDGTDGRTHHVSFPTLDATGDSPAGSIVELRQFDDAHGRAPRCARDALRPRSRRAGEGVRRDLARSPAHRARARPLGDGGFGAEVQAAMKARAEHLIEQGLARRQGQQVIFARDLLDTLRERELDAVGAKLAAETGRPSRRPRAASTSPASIVSASCSRPAASP